MTTTADIGYENAKQASLEFALDVSAKPAGRQAAKVSHQKVASLADQSLLKNFTVKRRLKGIVEENSGESWRVVFLENGKPFHYELPSTHLKEVGVELVNQPFEMDELVPRRPGLSGKLYRFRALAASDDAFLEFLPLDAERQRKRGAILAKFKKSSG